MVSGKGWDGTGWAEEKICFTFQVSIRQYSIEGSNRSHEGKERQKGGPEVDFQVKIRTWGNLRPPLV